MATILLVYTRGGPPLEYALPRIAACGELHVLAVMPMPTGTEHLWRSSVAAITPAWSDHRSGDELVALIVEHARRLGADAVLTLSEYAVVAVARAAGSLGLRGGGPNVVRSRDKRLMRETWRDAGVPVPAFRTVDGEADLRAAYEELTAPILLKSAWGAGSIGQVLIETGADVATAWAQATGATRLAGGVGHKELHEPRAADQFLVEEVIHGSTRTWYEPGSGWGDYVSVEGIVAGGTYHPICITGRIPTIPPFTELSNLAPCGLPEPLQRRIEAVARDAVDALELDTCGTHTEIKLADDGEAYVIESAARLGGVMVAAEVEAVFGHDLIAMLVREHLGELVSYPDPMPVAGTGAAGSLSLIATDSTGKPWQHRLTWDSAAVDWSGILSPGSVIEAVPGLSIPDGTPMPVYDPSNGAINYGGIFYLRAADAHTLVRDCHAVLDNLEGALLAGHPTERVAARRSTSGGTA